MSIHVQCPQCGQQFAAPDHMLGQQAACLGCATPIAIGSGDTPTTTSSGLTILPTDNPADGTLGGSTGSVFDSIPTSPLDSGAGDFYAGAGDMSEGGMQSSTGPMWGNEAKSDSNVGKILLLVGGIGAFGVIALAGFLWVVFSSDSDPVDQPEIVSSSPSTPSRGPSTSPSRRPSVSPSVSPSSPTPEPTGPPKPLPEPDPPANVGTLSKNPVRLQNPSDIKFAGAGPRFVFAHNRVPAGISVFDLASGERIQQATRSNYSEQLLAGSPDGKHLLINGRIGDRNCEIWSVNPMKQITRVSPFGGQPIGSAIFGTNDRVMVFSSQGKMNVLSVPEGQLIAGADGLTLPGATPGGRYFVAAKQTDLLFFDSKTGKHTASVPFEESISAWDIRPDGKLVAAITSVSVRPTLRIVDVSRKDQMPPTSIPAARALKWCGDDHLLLDSKYLYSIKQRRPVCRYENLRALQATTDGRMWCQNRNDLVPVPLPGAEANATTKDWRPAVPAGSQVTVSLNSNGYAPPETENEFRRLLADRVRAAGYKIANGQPYHFQLELSATDTGGVIQLQRSIGFRAAGGETIDFQDQRVSFTLRLVDDAGTAHWKTERNGTLLGYRRTVKIPNSEDPREFLIRNAWQNLTTALRQCAIPPEIVNYDSLTSVSPTYEYDPEWLRRQQAVEDQARTKRRFSSSNTSDLPERHESVKWSVKPFVVPPAETKPPTRPLQLGDGEVTSVFFAFPNKMQFAVELKPTSGAPSSVVRHQLRPKKKLAETPLKPAGRLLDFRPDGRLLLTSTNTAGNQLEILQCGESADKLVASVDVSEHVPFCLKAGFVGANRFYAATDKQFTMWELPSGKHVYGISVRDCFVDASRTYMVGLADGRLRVFDTAHGTAAGDLQSVTSSIERIHSAAFDPRGKWLAATIESKERITSRLKVLLAIWNLKDGSLADWYAVDGASSVRWGADDHVVVGGQLYDLKRKRLVWRYAMDRLMRPLPVMRHVESSDGRGWWVVTDQKRQKHLVWIEMPNDKVADAVTTIDSAEAGKVATGTQVKFSVEVPDEFPNSREITSQLEDHFGQELARHRLAITDRDASPVRCQVRIRQDSAFSREAWKISKGTRELIVPETTWSATVNMGLWETKLSVSLRTIDYAVDWTANDPVADLNRQIGEAIVATLKKVQLPQNWERRSHDRMYGSSMPTPNGEVSEVESQYRGLLPQAGR